MHSAELNGPKMSMKGPKHTFYTEIFVDRPRLRLPFLKIVIQFGKDEQALSLNDNSFFNVVGIPFLSVPELFTHASVPACVPLIGYCCCSVW